MDESPRIATPVSVQQEEELFNILLNASRENDYSFALWKLPNSQTKNLIISFSSTPPNVSLEELPSGFIFSPFDKQKSSHFLKADLSFCFSDGTLNEPRNPAEMSSQNWLQEVVANTEVKKAIPYYPQRDSSGGSISKDDFEKLIQESVQQIEAGVFEK